MHVNFHSIVVVGGSSLSSGAPPKGSKHKLWTCEMINGRDNKVAVAPFALL